MKQVIAIVVFVMTVNVFGATMSTLAFNAAVDKAVKFVIEKENFRSSWYDDKTGKTLAAKNAKCVGTPTIGHGLTGVYWDKQTITPEQSKAIVRGIVEQDAREILKALNRAPSINNLAALCSLAYRRGVRPVLRSKTFKAVNDRNWGSVIKEWKGFNTSKGEPMPGLNKRCKEELRLFFFGR